MKFTERTLSLPESPIAEAHNWLSLRTSQRSLLDLSQAAPSYPTSPEISDRIAAVAKEPDGGFYAPSAGVPALNDAFAQEMTDSYLSKSGPLSASSISASSISANNVLPVAGCNQAFCLVASALCQPGDEIIVPLPYYFNHDMWLKADGVRPLYLDSGPDLLPDPEAAAKLITERTRAILLVTPGNPSGVTLSPGLIGEFYDLAASAGIALLVDETYRNFREVTSPPHNLFSRPDWEETLVSLHSFSKDLAIPGYRVGAVVASSELLAEVMKLLDCVQISPSRIGQEAVAAGLRYSLAWRQSQRERVLGNLATFRQVMDTRPGGFELATSGAFFGWVRHPFAKDGLDTAEVVKRLVLEHDVLAIGGTAFTPQDESWLRFSYANLEADQFELLAERLSEMGHRIRS